jgi:hypothetical protein
MLWVLKVGTATLHRVDSALVVLDLLGRASRCPFRIAAPELSVS